MRILELDKLHEKHERSERHDGDSKDSRFQFEFWIVNREMQFKFISSRQNYAAGKRAKTDSIYANVRQLLADALALYKN